MTVASLRVAQKICELSDWKVTNLSLQKIIYFCHMIYMGRNEGTSLVEDDFQAWMYGPVLPTLYEKYKKYGADSIPNRFYGVAAITDENLNSFIEEVAGALLKREPWELVTLTHSKNGAWAKNYVPGHNKTIPNADIIEEYAEFKR